MSTLIWVSMLINCWDLIHVYAYLGIYVYSAAQNIGLIMKIGKGNSTFRCPNQLRFIYVSTHICTFGVVHKLRYAIGVGGQQNITIANFIKVDIQ